MRRRLLVLEAVFHLVVKADASGQNARNETEIQLLVLRRLRRREREIN